MDDQRYGESDLEARVVRWRARQEQASSLSPRELDELEDHLRARVNLEMELNAAISPAQAFRIARHDMGTGSALSQEFAKAGKPRWKGLFLAGWAMFAASFLLPVTGFELLSEYANYARASGLEVFLRCLRSPSYLPFALTSLAMLGAIPVFGSRTLAGSRWLRRFLGCAGVGALGLSGPRTLRPRLLDMDRLLHLRGRRPSPPRAWTGFRGAESTAWNRSTGEQSCLIWIAK